MTRRWKESKATVSFSLSESSVDKLGAISEGFGISRSELLEDIIKQISIKNNIVIVRFQRVFKKDKL
jgi:hypothetical protein